MSLIDVLLCQACHVSSEHSAGTANTTSSSLLLPYGKWARQRGNLGVLCDIFRCDIDCTLCVSLMMAKVQSPNHWLY